MTWDTTTLLLFALVGVALLFDFLNGLHDAANSIATIVSTRVLPARYAVIWAAFFNFIAFAIFGQHVAQTVGKGIISPGIVSDAVIFGALGGAITWNIVTWLGGIPSSSSHALIGGLLGAGIAKAGLNPVVWSLEDSGRHCRLAGAGPWPGAHPGADRLLELREDHARLRRRRIPQAAV